MRFFNPQYAIEHAHPQGVSWCTGPDGQYARHCDRPTQYEVLIYSEGWGLFPVQGSGNKTSCEIPESKGHVCQLLTQTERDAFFAQYFPATREFELERADLSLCASGL